MKQVSNTTASQNSNILNYIGEDTVLWSPSRNYHKKASELISNKVILLYFSSYWCGPCKKFTPLLCDLYTTLKTRIGECDDFEVILCSTDAFESEYSHYCKIMPWLCLPFQSPITASLSTQFRAEGLPCLVVLDRDGKVISRDAVSQVSSDPMGIDFPWRPKALVDILPEYYLPSPAATTGGDRCRMRDLDHKYLMIYVAGQWCRLSRCFTATLTNAYINLKSQRDDFEILFLSSDRSRDSFDSFFGQMPFGAILFEDNATKTAIADKFSIRQVPLLLVFGPRPACGGDRPLLNADARPIFESNAYIKDFPYMSQRWGDLNRTEHDMNKSKSIVVFCECCDDAKQEAIVQVLRCAGDNYNGTEDMKFFWVLHPTQFTQSLRDALNLPKRQETPLMILLNLGNNGAYYVSDWEDISIETVQNFTNQPGVRRQI